MIDFAGYKSLMATARTGAQKEEKQRLPTLPDLHFDLEQLRDRPVQTDILKLLLQSKSDAGFATCVLLHGMGGTGKVSGLTYILVCPA